MAANGVQNSLLTDRDRERRVLIAAPTGRDAEILCHTLREAGINTAVCSHLEELCHELEDGAAAAILAEEVLTRCSQSRLVEALVRQPEWSDLPMIVMTAGKDVNHRGWHLLNEASGSAHAVLLQRPVGKLTLLSSVRTAIQSRARQYQVRDELIRRKQAEQALRESEERFRMLADNMSQFAWIADEKGWIFWYNQRWYDYTGTTLEEMQGWGWTKVHHPDHVDRVVARIQHSWDTGEVWEDTFPLRGKDGEYRWFLSRALPIRNQDGRVVRWFGTNTDVTEQRSLEQTLKEADRRKDEFLAMLGHELRNPLAPIRSGLDILSMEKGSRNRETIELMQAQVEHLIRLVDDLLDVSRIMRGKIELRRQSVNLSDLVRRSVNAVSGMIESRAQKLHVTLPEVPVWLYADPVRLVQIIDNLLTNASKYNEIGGRIELTAECHTNQAVIRVRDTGVGIEPELVPHVFELFTQSSRSLDRAEGGLGIGLSLAKRLVEMHKGSISAESAGVGRGSTFLVRLPTVEAPAHSDEESQQYAVARRCRILVVDDNIAAAEMFAALLSKLGNHDVQIAHDGPSALTKANQIRPDIVFLDIGLPGMDGYQVASRLRQDREMEYALLVALTGYGQREDRRRSHQAGFDEHLVKPPSVDQVNAVLAHPRLSEGGRRHDAVVCRPREDPSSVGSEQTPTGDPLAAVGAASSPPEADLRQIKHNIGNTAYALKLAVQMLVNSSGDAAMIEKVSKGLDKEVRTLDDVIETLKSAIETH